MNPKPTTPKVIQEPIDQRVFEIIAAKAKGKATTVGSETSLEALGIDSLDMTEIVFELEDAFDIQIPDTAEISDRFRELSTAGSAVDLVRSLLVQKGSVQ